MNAVLWIVQALLAALFLFAGSMKFIMPIEEMTKQMPSMPGWFLRFIGVVEILGGLGLILPGLLRIKPGLTPLAAAGHRVTDFTPDTICDGLRGTLGEPNFALLAGRAVGASGATANDVEVLVVDDADTVAAMRLAWSRLKQIVEPSSATVLAALLRHRARFAGLRVGAVLSGGNVDLDAVGDLFGASGTARS